MLMLLLWGWGVMALAEREYLPGTPPWVPVIDECIAAGGARNDCIEALPPELYGQFLEWERGPEWRRGPAVLARPRIPSVPPAAELPDIYRSPLSIPSLRADVAAALARMGCLIPHNTHGEPAIATGEFAVAGQQDIAVLCSIDGKSSLHVFWGGPDSCPPLTDVQPDWALLHRHVDWEYRWWIAVAGPDQVRQYYERYPEECPTDQLPPLEHAAIVDIHGESGSVNLYCHEGRWHRLCGSD